MPDFIRYAVYYCPDDPVFMDAGATWLGWDLATGTHLTTIAAQHYTTRPQKYGFHATLKPPFRMASGTSNTALHSALKKLASTASPVVLSGLTISKLGRFFALTAQGDTSKLDAIATLCVTHLDEFRAPLNQAELNKRQKSNLNPAQNDNLVNWGYPYVLDQFRFHMTVTGPLDQTDQAKVQLCLEQHFEPFLHRPLAINSICLVGEDASGYFHLVSRFPLG